MLWVILLKIRDSMVRHISAIEKESFRLSHESTTGAWTLNLPRYRHWYMLLVEKFNILLSKARPLQVQDSPSLQIERQLCALYTQWVLLATILNETATQLITLN